MSYHLHDEICWYLAAALHCSLVSGQAFGILRLHCITVNYRFTGLAARLGLGTRSFGKKFVAKQHRRWRDSYVRIFLNRKRLDGKSV